MKKLFIPMAALAMFTLVACGNTPASSPAASSEASSSVGPTYSHVVMETVTISNKEALQAEWHKGEANRAIEIESNPKININAAIAAGDLKITSSDENVIKVLGRNLSVVDAGTATITVTYDDKSDTVEITALAALGEPDYVVGKSLADLMAVEKLVADGDNKRGTEVYAIKVKVAVLGSKADGSKDKDKYGNMYVTAEDGSGDKVQVYGSSASIDALAYDMALGAYKFPGKKDYLENPFTDAIKVGDVLDVLAIRADYKTTPEISMVIRSVNGVVIPNKIQTTDEVLATALTNQVKQQVFGVTGKIVALGSKADGSATADKYGNMFIKTEGAEGNALQVYGSTASASALAVTNGEVKFTNPKDFLENDKTKDLKVGDEVNIIAIRCDYQDKIEITGILIFPEDIIEESSEASSEASSEQSSAPAAPVYQFSSKAKYDFTKTEYAPASGQSSVHFNDTTLKAYMAANVTGIDIVTAAAVENGDSGAVYVNDPAAASGPNGAGIKFSSGSKNGKVTFTLSEAVNSVKFTGRTWKDTELAKIDINGKSVTMTATSAAAAEDFLVVLDAPATSLVLTVTKRAVFTVIDFGTASEGTTNA
ncbi:MAG: hypothetical protein E7182_04800 [Erysipelotrichaceae bacterium]|nr:hypothetical protein [Erysipelotrichaceae bacterium]